MEKPVGFVVEDIARINVDQLPQVLSEIVRETIVGKEKQSGHQYHSDEPKHDHSRDD